MYVYAEEVFLTNFLMDMIMCVCVCRIKGVKKYFLRCVAAASAGGIYSLICLYIRTGFISRAGVCVMMAGIIQTKDLRNVPATAFLLMGISAIMSAGVVFLSCSSSSCVYPQDMITMIAGALSAVLIFIMCTKQTHDINALKGITDAYTAEFAGRCEQFILLNDTGNLLTTQKGERVVILSERAFFSLFPEMKEISSLHPHQAEAAFPEEYLGKISFIYACGISGKCLMPVIKADRLYSDKITLSPAYISCAEINADGFDGIINLHITGGYNDKKDN